MWHSVQVFVSVARTVWGTKVLKACPLNPSAATVCCCEYTHSRFWFWEPTSTAQEERAGEMRCFITVGSMASMNTSSRIVWKSYDVQFRSVSPSQWRSGLRRFARMGRGQPEQLVTPEVGQRWHGMR